MKGSSLKLMEREIVTKHRACYFDFLGIRDSDSNQKKVIFNLGNIEVLTSSPIETHLNFPTDKVSHNPMTSTMPLIKDEYF